MTHVVNVKEHLAKVQDFYAGKRIPDDGGFDRNVIKPGTLIHMIDYIHMNTGKTWTLRETGRMEVVKCYLVFGWW